MSISPPGFKYKATMMGYSIEKIGRKQKRAVTNTLNSISEVSPTSNEKLFMSTSGSCFGNFVGSRQHHTKSQMNVAPDGKGEQLFMM